MVYSDYIRLVSSYLPGRVESAKFFYCPTLLTRPRQLPGPPIVNVELFGFSTSPSAAGIETYFLGLSALFSAAGAGVEQL